MNEDNEVMLITTEGIIIRIPCSGISVVGRIASGVKLMDVDSENVSIAGIAKVREEGAEGGFRSFRRRIGGKPGERSKIRRKHRRLGDIKKI